MLKKSKSILIICIVSLFLIMGQISASDTDSMVMDDMGAIDDSIESDMNLSRTNELEELESVEQENSNNLMNDEDPMKLIEKTKYEDSIEIIEKTKDTSGIVMANDNYSCGPASLATVLNKYGINISLNEVYQHTNTTLDGTSMQSLIDAAKYYNFSAYGVEADTLSLQENYIVHLDINGCQHWTVIRKVTDTHVFLADSTEGNINFTIDEFNLYYTKKAIFLSNNNSIDLEKEIFSNQVRILDKDQCSNITGKGLKKKVVGYRIVWKYGFIQKYGWVLKPKVVGGHVSFSQWEYVKGYYSVWGKYKVKEPIYKYYFVSDESLTNTIIKKTKK